MVNVKSPLIDAKMDEQSMAYVGVLERQVVGLTILTAQLRAVLESITGQRSEEYIKDMEDKTIREVAEYEIKRRLNATDIQARHLANKMFRGEEIYEEVSGRKLSLGSIYAEGTDDQPSEEVE